MEIGGMHSNRVIFLMLVIICALYATPMLYDIKLMVVFWIVLVFVGLLKPKIKSDCYLKKLSICGILYMFMCAIYKTLGVSTATLNLCMVPIIYFFPIYALSLFDKTLTSTQILLMFNLLALFIAINIADSIRISIMYPMDVTYQVLSEELEREGYTFKNLGGSSFVSMAIFYLNIMIISIYNSSGKKEKYLYILYAVLAFWFIVMCSLKVSAIIFAFVAIVLQFIAHKNNKNSTSAFVIFIILTVLLFLFKDTLLNFIANTIGSDRVSSRLLSFTSSSTETNSSFRNRENLWQVSIDTWLSSFSSFLFGIGERSYIDYMSTAASGIGNHSDLLDVLARYGIIGGILFYGSLWYLYKYLMAKFGTKFKNEIKATFILLILVGLTKKIMSYEVAMTTFWLLPLCLMKLSKDNINNANT